MFIYIDWNESGILKSTSTRYPTYDDLHLHMEMIRKILSLTVTEWYRCSITYSHDEFTISIIDGYVPTLVKFMKSASEYMSENVPPTSQIFVYVFYILMNKLGDERKLPSIRIPDKYSRDVIRMMMSRLYEHPVEIRSVRVQDIDRSLEYRLNGVDEIIRIPALVEINQSGLLTVRSLDCLLRMLIKKTRTSIREDLIRAHIKLITGSVTECRDLCHLVDILHMRTVSNDIVYPAEHIDECLRYIVELK